MKPLCDLCGDRHDAHQAHRFATNSATNKSKAATNAVVNGATNAGEGQAVAASVQIRGGVRKKASGGSSGQALGSAHEAVAVPLAVEAERPAVSGKALPEGRTANRRDREAYRAYQREYMRKRRQK